MVRRNRAGQGDKAERFPFVLNLLAAEHVAAKAGLEIRNAVARRHRRRREKHRFPVRDIHQIGAFLHVRAPKADSHAIGAARSWRWRLHMGRQPGCGWTVIAQRRRPDFAGVRDPRHPSAILEARGNRRRRMPRALGDIHYCGSSTSRPLMMRLWEVGVLSPPGSRLQRSTAMRRLR